MIRINVVALSDIRLTLSSWWQRGYKTRHQPTSCDNIFSTTLYIFLPTYLILFNIIYESGIVPEEWRICLIKPIYKNKSDPMKHENYRPITLLSCLGKVFTCILNHRLKTFANEINLLKENQAGFRKSYSTLDHVFLSNILLQRKKYVEPLLTLNRYLIQYGAHVYGPRCRQMV